MPDASSGAARAYTSLNDEAKKSGEKSSPDTACRTIRPATLFTSAQATYALNDEAKKFRESWYDMWYSKQTVAEYGTRNCPNCRSCFLGKFVFGETTCRKCGSTFSSAFDSSY